MSACKICVVLVFDLQTEEAVFDCDVAAALQATCMKNKSILPQLQSRLRFILHSHESLMWQTSFESQMASLQIFGTHLGFISTGRFPNI